MPFHSFPFGYPLSLEYSTSRLHSSAKFYIRSPSILFGSAAKRNCRMTANAAFRSRTLSRVAMACRRWQRDDRGATAIEFAMVAMPFFMFCFGILGVGLHYFSTNSLEHAVEAAARKIRTGQAQNSGHDRGRVQGAGLLRGERRHRLLQTARARAERRRLVDQPEVMPGLRQEAGNCRARPTRSPTAPARRPRSCSSPPATSGTSRQ